jgi:rSAM/selenodomain-associated transferase 1
MQKRFDANSQQKQTSVCMSIGPRVLDLHFRRDLPKGLCALAVMTKVPRAGEVKTRLIPPLTPDEAALLNRSFLSDTFTAITNATCDGLTRGVAVFTPIGAEQEIEAILPKEFELLPQRGDAFGERLIFAVQDLFSFGFESVCLIDSDSPTVPVDFFSEAAAILSKEPNVVVLGPSEDGGYYLIGSRVLHRELFQGIDWSTDRVLEQTIERARELALEVRFLPEWYDIDDRIALRRLCSELFGPRDGNGHAYPAPVTKACLEKLLQGAGRERILA